MPRINQPSVELSAAEVNDLAQIPHKMAKAWNGGDADAFASPFSATADFIAFEGTHLEGRDAIAAFHRQIFATVVKGSRIAATVRFVRAVAPDVAVVHAAAGVTLAGHTEPSPGRLSMQLFVVVRGAGGTWQVEAMENARQLTLERQAMLDAYDDASPQSRADVDRLLAPVK
jgi:uncharacterized protein (TIGR02246 family)